MQRQSVISAVVLLLACSFSSGQTQIERLPIPKSPEQVKAEHFVKLHYATQYAQHDAAGQLALSHQLRDEINQYADDGPTRFVMLREARELALDGGDLDAALAAINEMGRIFAVDTQDLKLSAMSSFTDKSGLPLPVLIDKYLHLADTALDTADVTMAQKAYILASSLSDQQRDATIKQRVKQEHIAIMDAVREGKAILAAMNKVKMHPDDAVANLQVGKYACFVRQLWSLGLPYLAKSSDEKLKALAQQELDATTPDATLAAADAWWDYAASATGKPAERAKLHAADLYRQVLPNLSGEKKDRAQDRSSSIPLQ
jgi:hypothetical protein